MIQNSIPSSAQGSRAVRANTLILNNPTTPPIPALTPALQPLNGITAPTPPAGPPAPLPPDQWVVGLGNIPCIGQPGWAQWQYARLWLNPEFEALPSFSYSVSFIRNLTDQTFPAPAVELTYYAYFNPGDPPGSQLRDQRTTVMRGTSVFEGATMALVSPGLVVRPFQYNINFDEYVIFLAINST
jgi:hypothetical protein